MPDLRPMPYYGWTIFQRNSRTEWPIASLVRYRRKDAIQAYKDAYKDRATGERYYAEHIKDGSIRVGKVVVRAVW
ncbi:MAG: hypothetical protein JNK34_11325 [Tabrizicola sp.]|nr:hypothetical protein [Tabrizicola sp.]